MNSTKLKPMMIRTLADAIVGISDLKRNPAEIFEAADGRTLLVMNYSRPVAYVVPLETWEQVVDALKELRETPALRERLSGIRLP